MCDPSEDPTPVTARPDAARIETQRRFLDASIAKLCE
jgi:hypothetical protein